MTEVTAGPYSSFGFNLGKVPGQGEDSDPILRDGPDLALAAVFDGMGGAGGTVYDTPDGARSGAYLASRIARDVVEQHLLETLTPDGPLPLAATALELHDALDAALKDELKRLNAPTSGLRSRLLRALPTTMALGALQRTEPDGSSWMCHVLWAGDSRVYALDAFGLHQLSIDDLRDPGDAMANLEHESVISNAISADTEFHINHRQVTLQAPFALISATDGCFGYVSSPMHFEGMVLRALADATTDDQWSSALQDEISATTGDDAAMAVVVVGADLPGFQQLLAPRTNEILTEYTAPLDAQADEIERLHKTLGDLQARHVAELASRWRLYRPGYEQLLQDDPNLAMQPNGQPTQRQLWNPPKPISTGDSDATTEPVEGLVDAAADDVAVDVTRSTEES